MVTERSGRDVDDKILTRVRGLLAKAESTTFTEEAAALTAKAQELMSRHAIDSALLDAADPGQGGPERRRIVVERPYASAKESLLAGVATANRCRAVFAGDGVTHLFGFAPDLEATEVLFTSLLVQATTELAAAGSHTDAAGRSRTRSFRHAFLLAFAARVEERLRATVESATERADAAVGGALVPVLVKRDQAVDSVLADAFPHLRTRRLTVSSPAGVSAGRWAGSRADLGRTGIRPDDQGRRGLTG